MNVIKNLPEKKNMAPSLFAQEYIAYANSQSEVIRTWKKENEMLKAYGTLYKGSGPNEGYTFFHLVIGNDQTGTLYLIIFETPSEDWEREWAIMEKTIQMMRFDGEF